MKNKNIILVGLPTMCSVFAACLFLTLSGTISNLAAIISLCANIKGLEYIVVAAFIGILPAFFKAIHDDTHNRRAMKLF